MTFRSTRAWSPALQIVAAILGCLAFAAWVPLVQGLSRAETRTGRQTVTGQHQDHQRNPRRKYEFLVEDKKGLNDLAIGVTPSWDHDSVIFAGAAN